VAEFCYKRPAYKPPMEDSQSPPKRTRLDEAESEAGKNDILRILSKFTDSLYSVSFNWYI
jgi:hypothetical protein